MGKVPTLKDIKREAKRMLEKDFLIQLTDEDKAYLQSLKTEIQVEQFTHRIITNHNYY